MKHLLIGFGVLLACSSNGQDIPELPIPQLLARLPAARDDTARLHLLLELADAYVLKPGEDPHDLDSALLIIGQVEKANTSVACPYIRDLCLLVKARANREKGNRTLAGTYAFQALEAFRRTRVTYPAELGYADYEAANYLNYLDPKEDSQRVALYREAVPLFEKTGKTEMKAEILQIMGDCISQTLYLPDALPPLLEALKIYQSIGRVDVRDVCGLLGAAYSGIGDHRTALKYGLMAVRVEDSMPFSYMRYLTYHRVGVIYFQLSEFVPAENFEHKAVEAAERLNDTDAIRSATHNWINALIQQKKYDSALPALDQLIRRYPASDVVSKVIFMEPYCHIYLMQHRLELVRPMVLEFMRIDSTLAPDDFLHHFCEPDIIQFFLATKKYDQARQYGLRFLDYCIRRRLSSKVAVAYHMLFEADSAQGRMNRALVEYQQSVSIKDSVLGVEKSKQLAAMQLEFDTEKKDRDIRDLTQKQQLSQLALGQASLTRNFTIAGAALLLVLLLVLVNRYRLKQRSNRRLGHLLKEKEWLVKEIHHRVKNNLQIVMSLLNSQSAYIDNEPALTAIHDSQHRVHAMSLIHQKLYGSENISSINMSLYIRELTAYLGDSYETGQRIHFEFAIDPLEIDISQAVPLGLILNEAITNSVKYAFPDGRTGLIRISLLHIDAGHYLLLISDNGIGMPAKFAGKKPGSLGMSLMAGLTEDLNGTFSIENGVGTTIKIIFEYAPGNE